ncbi:MAG: bifunctional hydroxymethylpyrimidine kinase/phosphomethylpyrimidine kinase [Clostridia bacterium]|jgi:hydroxymethylpyrimidine/phosphomethylpyrimidine kinase|nr:bifunctional hydroxymethylpyrimidine kinase/phosphomethylpyrimidine kinase [Clostridia bacterium]
MKTVLTIAGSDCSGGAGIQADLKTITAHKMYGMSVLTALTAQNTVSVFEVMNVAPAFVGRQLDSIFTDIYPDAIKIGMVSSQEIIEAIGEKLHHYRRSDTLPPIVLDPVMISTSGKALIDSKAMDALKNVLIPMADMITPNIQEAEVLTGLSIKTAEEMVEAAAKIAAFYKGSILIKGGHLVDKADDLLYQKGDIFWFKAKKIGTKERHGTGCTLSSAIACHLANGLDSQTAVGYAKAYVAGALKTDSCLGNGSHPIDHTYNIR